MDNHPFAVDVAHFEQRCLGPANACSVEDHQHGAMHQVGSSLDHAGDFLGAQHHRQLSGDLRKDQVIVGNVPALQRLLVQKTQCRHASFYRAGRKVLIAK